MMELSLSALIARYSSLSFPTMCCCPTTSSSVVGRSREASVDADAAFCSACGQKMPEKPKPEPVKEEDVEVIPPEQPSEEPASETVSENASETPTKASAPDASTEA